MINLRFLSRIKQINDVKVEICGLFEVRVRSRRIGKMLEDNRNWLELLLIDDVLGDVLLYFVYSLRCSLLSLVYNLSV